MRGFSVPPIRFGGVHQREDIDQQGQAEGEEDVGDVHGLEVLIEPLDGVIQVLKEGNQGDNEKQADTSGKQEQEEQACAISFLEQLPAAGINEGRKDKGESFAVFPDHTPAGVGAERATGDPIRL